MQIPPIHWEESFCREAFSLFGLVTLGPPYRGGPPVRRIRGAPFRTVTVTERTGLAARLSARSAARALRRAGVREAVFPEGYTVPPVFERYGIKPVSPVPLYRATAASIVRLTLRQQAMPEAGITLAFTAGRVTPELAAAVRALASCARYITLAVPDCEALTRMLLREYGLAARIAANGEAIRADLTVCFDPFPAEGPCLPLYSEALPVSYDTPEDCPVPLLTALWRAGTVDASSLSVRSVG